QRRQFSVRRRSSLRGGGGITRGRCPLPICCSSRKERRIMSIIRVVFIASYFAGLFTGAVSAAEAPAGSPVMKDTEASPAETSFEVTNPYTAQRRPRVTVLAFDDTNTGAVQTRYGSSVEAMLVTFLKRKSQFVVIERQKLGSLLAEKQRLQKGMVQVAADDKEGQALLEKIDVFVLGSVTLLD